MYVKVFPRLIDLSIKSTYQSSNNVCKTNQIKCI